MSLANDSRFSSTASYFVPTVGTSGGSTLTSTVLINPDGGTGRINTFVSGAGASGQLELGPSLTNFKAVTIYDNGIVNGAGINITSSEPSTNGSSLNIVGPGTGAQANAAYIRVNSSTGNEELTLSASPTGSNVVLTPTATTFNGPVTLGVSGIANYAYDINGYNISTGAVVSCPDGAATVYPNPTVLLPGVHAIVSDNATSDQNLGTVGFYNVAGQWSAGCGTAQMGLPGAGGGAPSTMLSLTTNPAGQIVINNWTGEGARNIQLSFIRLSGPNLNVPV